MNITFLIIAKAIKKSYIYYKDFISWIKICNYKFIFSYWLDLLGGRKSFFYNIRFILKLFLLKINIYTIQDKKKYPKNHIWANIYY